LHWHLVHKLHIIAEEPATQLVNWMTAETTISNMTSQMWMVQQIIAKKVERQTVTYADRTDFAILMVDIES